MSDVAVTWAKAQECRDKSGNRDRNAKDVLKTMAAWADANGEVWAAVPVLALECEVSERTIQRGLRALKDMKLLIETGERKVYLGRVYPIYRMPLDQGHASTVRRLKAERQAAWGDTDVTPAGGLGVTRMSPQDDTRVTPRGDTGVTQIGKEITQGLKPSSRACAAAREAWATKAPERVAPRPVERAWLTAIERDGLSHDQLLGAVLAAVGRDPDFARGKAMNLDRWLDEGRYEPWLSALPAHGAAVAPPVWAGPANVAVAVAGAMGPAAVSSYLGTAGWDDVNKTVLAAHAFAQARLAEGAGRALKAIGVSVSVGSNGSARNG
ncbi:helix-turn-helix domain-containing protein [Brevundimonas sp.]|uniref:helix-turn-helix domain-containing protein n=1 Tax=Brevundimonas sp. TaxID=1871086 RepID=UPI002896F2A6|nr:helix-turn-helix domain-containing protein [Brevundimonas sp.]